MLETRQIFGYARAGTGAIAVPSLAFLVFRYV
jgi:hypothetical protein